MEKSITHIPLQAAKEGSLLFSAASLAFLTKNRKTEVKKGERQAEWGIPFLSVSQDESPMSFDLVLPLGTCRFSGDAHCKI